MKFTHETHEDGIVTVCVQADDGLYGAISFKAGETGDVPRWVRELNAMFGYLERRRRGEPHMNARVRFKDGERAGVDGLVVRIDREAGTVRLDERDSPDVPWSLLEYAP